MFDCLKCVAEVEADRSYCHLCLAETRTRQPLKETTNKPKEGLSDKPAAASKESKDTVTVTATLAPIRRPPVLSSRLLEPKPVVKTEEKVRQLTVRKIR